MMSKGLVVYKSKYGATKKYVDMLREELDCDMIESGSYGKIPCDQYDWIVFAGGIYASGISGLDVLRKHYPQIKARIAVFCVGASPFDEKAFEEIKKHNLKDDLRNIPVFYGRGAWNESKMGLIDRTLCKILQKAVAKKDPDSCEPWMKALLSAVGRDCDWTDREYLVPLIEYITSENCAALTFDK